MILKLALILILFGIIFVSAALGKKLDEMNDCICPKFEPIDSIDDEGRNSMDKCKFLGSNPLIDADICNEPDVNADAPGECVICDFHKTGTQHSCPRAKFHDDHVNHPNHYCQGGIECIKAIEASMPPDGFQDYCKGNVLKYIWCWRDKAGVEDLKKAMVYLNWMIESAEKENTQ